MHITTIILKETFYLKILASKVNLLDQNKITKITILTDYTTKINKYIIIKLKMCEPIKDNKITKIINFHNKIFNKSIISIIEENKLTNGLKITKNVISNKFIKKQFR